MVTGEYDDHQINEPTKTFHNQCENLIKCAYVT